jgi:hypothetical protein
MNNREMKRFLKSTSFGIFLTFLGQKRRIRDREGTGYAEGIFSLKAASQNEKKGQYLHFFM